VQPAEVCCFKDEDILWGECCNLLSLHGA
jgi:hypothetical protein